MKFNKAKKVKFTKLKYTVLIYHIVVKLILGCPRDLRAIKKDDLVIMWIIENE